MADEERDSRALIGDALEGYLTQEQLDALLREALSITKTGRGWCPGCKKAVMVEIADAKAVVSATAELLNQAKGRPTEQKRDTEIIVQRTVEYVCEHGHPCSQCARLEADSDGE